MSFQNIDDACRAACEAIGVLYKPVMADGRFHPADLINDPRGKNDGRIKIFPDQQGGIVFNYKSNEQQTFFVNDRRETREPIPRAELERIRREQQHRRAGEQSRQNKAAKKAQSLWQQAKPAPDDYPYLIRKQVGAHGSRVGVWHRAARDEKRQYCPVIIENALLLPMFDKAGVIRSLQAIFPEKHPSLDRDKDFLSGGARGGLFWWLGNKTEKELICEGFATAATLHEETGYRVYMAFAANNLLTVGRIVRENRPDATLVFCADNDTQTPGNPGLTYATEAAQAVGGSVAVPPIHGDFNDYAIYLKGLNNDSER